MFYIVEFGATFIEALIGILIIVRATGNKPDRWSTNLISSGLIAGVVLLLNQYQLFSVAISAVAVTCLTLCVGINYKSNLFDAFVWAVVYMMSIYIIDFFSISLLGVFLQKDQIARELTENFSYIRIALLGLSKGILGVVYTVLIKGNLKKENIKAWKVKLIVISGIAIIYALMTITFGNVDVSAVLLWGLLLIVLILGAYAFFQYLLYEQKQNDLIVAEERNNLITKNYETIIQNYQENRVFYHDLKNQYLVIENYIQSGQYEKAKEFMEEIKRKHDFELLKKWTGIESLDILLSCKKRDAEDQGIRTEILADAIHLNIDEKNIIALIGNAFDNAMEECQRREKDKWIRITIRSIREMVFIKVANPYQHLPEKKEGKFISNKTDQFLHGLGMLSMEMVVEKYQGTMSIDYKDGIFIITFLFFN